MARLGLRASLARLDLLERRASITEPRPECDLIARGVLDALRYSALRQDDGRYLDTDGATRDGSEVRSEAMMAGNVLTFSCVPPGSGERLALDR